MKIVQLQGSALEEFVASNADTATVLITLSVADMSSMPKCRVLMRSLCTGRTSVKFL